MGLSVRAARNHLAMPGCRLTISHPDPEQELTLLLAVSTAMAYLHRELPGVEVKVSQDIDASEPISTLTIGSR